MQLLFHTDNVETYMGDQLSITRKFIFLQSKVSYIIKLALPFGH